MAYLGALGEMVMIIYNDFDSMATSMTHTKPKYMHD